MPPKPMSLFFSGIFLVLSIMVATLAKQESTPALQAKNWDSANILNQNTSAGPHGLSTLSDYAVLDACQRIAKSANVLLAPSAIRLQVLQTCQNLSTEIANSSRQNAYALAALAYFAGAQAQTDVMNQALKDSYAAAPNAQWIAQQRVAVAEAHFSVLHAATKTGHLGDLALLVQSESGVHALAQRYINKRDFRARMTRVIEPLPADTQQRFLRRLDIEMRHP